MYYVYRFIDFARRNSTRLRLGTMIAAVAVMTVDCDWLYTHDDDGIN